MNSEGDALLAAILQEPGDVVHRLVYADWLNDQGEIKQAAFIRRWCGPETVMEHAAGCYTPWACRHADIPRCWKKHKLRWEWRRGFVGGVSVTPAVFDDRRRTAELFRRQPVVEVVPRGKGPVRTGMFGDT
jgi:uncharacterized protein (TIGR02996 family)